MPFDLLLQLSSFILSAVLVFFKICLSLSNRGLLLSVAFEYTIASQLLFQGPL